MESATQLIKLLTEVAILVSVLWSLWKTHENGAKIDILKEQTNGLTKKLEEGNRAIGAAQARKEDKLEAERAKSP